MKSVKNGINKQNKGEKMTLQELKTMSNNLMQAIHDYKNQGGFNEIELERTIDELLCRLPRDIVYVEWFDRSDIENMANGVFDEPVDEDMIDICMNSLDHFNGSIMENEMVESIVADTVREHKKGFTNEYSKYNA